MSSFSAVVFDLDDTLYSEREYVYSGFAAVAEAFADQLGNSRDSISRMCRLFDTQHRARVFNALLAELGMYEDKALIEKLINVYRTHRPTIQLFDDVETALTVLRADYRLGLLTDGRSTTQSLKIDALGLRRRIDATVISGELGPGFDKPHPRSFEIIAKMLQVEANRCVYVADNPAKDFVAPNNLGWLTVQIRRAGGLYADQKPAVGGKARLFVDTLAHLHDLLHAL